MIWWAISTLIGAFVSYCVLISLERYKRMDKRKQVIWLLINDVKNQINRIQTIDAMLYNKPKTMQELFDVSVFYDDKVFTALLKDIGILPSELVDQTISTYYLLESFNNKFQQVINKDRSHIRPIIDYWNNRDQDIAKIVLLLSSLYKAGGDKKRYKEIKEVYDQLNSGKSHIRDFPWICE